MAAISAFRSQSFFANAFANAKKDFRSTRAAPFNRKKNQSLCKFNSKTFISHMPPMKKIYFQHC